MITLFRAYLWTLSLFILSLVIVRTFWKFRLVLMRVSNIVFPSVTKKKKKVNSPRLKPVQTRPIPTSPLAGHNNMWYLRFFQYVYINLFLRMFGQFLWKKPSRSLEKKIGQRNFFPLMLLPLDQVLLSKEIKVHCHNLGLLFV